MRGNEAFILKKEKEKADLAKQKAQKRTEKRERKKEIRKYKEALKKEHRYGTEKFCRRRWIWCFPSLMALMSA